MYTDDVAKMKEIIGCTELTHEIVHQYLGSGFWNTGKLLPWEHFGKAFQEMYCPMKREFLTTGIYFCNYQNKLYYFGLGLEEPFVSDDMIENGIWRVYTWAD